MNDVSVGVDVGSRAGNLSGYPARGAANAAVLVITSDFEEIEALCARAFVFVRGVLKTELTGMEATVPLLSPASSPARSLGNQDAQ